MFAEDGFAVLGKVRVREKDFRSLKVAFLYVCVEMLRSKAVALVVGLSAGFSGIIRSMGRETEEVCRSC